MKQTPLPPQTTAEETGQVRDTSAPPATKTCQDCRYFRQYEAIRAG